MRDYKKEYREYHARPEQKRNRAARNLWNRRLKGRVPAGKEIDHKQPLANGGSNTRANIRYRSVSANRADKSHMKTASTYEVGRTLNHCDRSTKMSNLLDSATHEAFRNHVEKLASSQGTAHMVPARMHMYTPQVLSKEASLLGLGAAAAGMFLPVMKTNLLGENLAKIRGMRVLKGNLLGNKVRNKFLRLQDGKGAGRNYTTERFENLAYGPAMIPIEHGLTGLTTAIHHARVRKAGGALPEDISLNFKEDTRAAKQAYDTLKDQAASRAPVDTDAWVESAIKNRKQMRKLERDEKLLGRNLTISELSDALSEEPVRKALSSAGIDVTNPQVALRQLFTRFGPPDLISDDIKNDTTLGELRKRLIDKGEAARVARLGEPDENAGIGTKVRGFLRDNVFDPNMTGAEQTGALLRHMPLDASENLYDGPALNALSRAFGGVTRATGSDVVDEKLRGAGRGALKALEAGTDRAESYGNRAESYGNRASSELKRKLKERFDAIKRRAYAGREPVTVHVSPRDR